MLRHEARNAAIEFVNGVAAVAGFLRVTRSGLGEHCTGETAAVVSGAVASLPIQSTT